MENQFCIDQIIMKLKAGILLDVPIASTNA